MPLKLSPTQVAFNARGDGKFNKPFPEQVEFLRKKLDLPTERWDDILKSAHDRAFVVAGAAKADLVSDFHQAINRAAAEGKSIQWFRKEFDAIVQKHGWEGWTGSDSKEGRDWRTRVIYQTNLLASHAAARRQQLLDPDVLKTRPYWKYIHNETVRFPRPEHLAWDGLVLHHTDPFWQDHYPPNGFGCRCRVTAVRPREYKGDKAPKEELVKHVDNQGNEELIPKGIDRGWNYAPGANTDTSFTDLIDQKLIKIPPSIGADMWQALKPALMVERAKSVRDMVAQAAASMEPAGVAVVAHTLAPATVEALKPFDVELQDAAVWLRDRELIHAIRDAKVDRGAALPLEVWLNLPEYLDGAEAYFDTQDEALIYAFDVPNEAGKIVVRINRLEKVRSQGARKKVQSNFIATGGIIDFSDLAENRYKRLDIKP